MSKPCIICVAITGSVPTKADNPAVPTTIPEQIESTHAAFEAGATIAHCHVRNDDQTPTSDPDKFAALKEGLEKHCPGMIVQMSTGGRSGSGRERGGMIPLQPDMCSLTVGSNNFPTRVYENSPDLVDWLSSEMLKYEVKPEIEAFDLSHIHHAAKMQAEGKLAPQVYIQFVMGVKNAMPVDRDVFDYYVKTMQRLLPNSEWCAAGIGAGQIVLNEWCVANGGHARTGLE
ncbi:MAG: 3-keto-5-aminohexanoate cleavage protein, partial [Pseudomonadota bacterium]